MHTRMVMVGVIFIHSILVLVYLYLPSFLLPFLFNILQSGRRCCGWHRSEGHRLEVIQVILVPVSSDSFRGCPGVPTGTVVYQGVAPLFWNGPRCMGTVSPSRPC